MVIICMLLSVSLYHIHIHNFRFLTPTPPLFLTPRLPSLPALRAGKTTRQRALDRQRDDEVRDKKIADDKRMREEKRLADDAARKKAVRDRKERIEQRVFDLVKVNSQVRVPQVHTNTNTYVVVDCLCPEQVNPLHSCCLSGSISFCLSVEYCAHTCTRIFHQRAHAHSYYVYTLTYMHNTCVHTHCCTQYHLREH